MWLFDTYLMQFKIILKTKDNSNLPLAVRLFVCTTSKYLTFHALLPCSGPRFVSRDGPSILVYSSCLTRSYISLPVQWKQFLAFQVPLTATSFWDDWLFFGICFGGHAFQQRCFFRGRRPLLNYRSDIQQWQLVVCNVFLSLLLSRWMHHSWRWAGNLFLLYPLRDNVHSHLRHAKRPMVVRGVGGGVGVWAMSVFRERSGIFVFWS